MDERPSPSDGRAWERRFGRVLEVLPYALLAFSTVLSLIQPDQTLADRLVTVGLVALAAAWILFTYTLRPPRWRQRAGAMVVYFAGMLGLAAVLTARSVFFVAFAVTGLVQAFLLLPTALAFTAVFATSVVIYTVPGGFPEPTVQAVSGWVFIIVLQTALTGFFSFMGMRLMEEDKQRRELLARLEAALEENAGLHAQLLTQAGRPGSWTSGSDWRARSTTPWPRASPASSPSSRPPNGPATDPSSGTGTWTRRAPWPGTASARRAGRCRRCGRSPWRTPACRTPSPTSPSAGRRPPRWRRASRPTASRGRCSPSSR
jgi:hypothetical protein